MSVLDAIRDSSESTVQAGGLEWRVRSIDSAALAFAGVSQLLLVPSGPLPPQAPKLPDLEALAVAPAQEEPADRAVRLAALQAAQRAHHEAAINAARSMGAVLVSEGQRQRLGLVCAGLVAARSPAVAAVDATATSPAVEAVPATEWEPIRAVLTPEEEAQHATPPRVWVGRIPTEACRVLADAIEDLSIDGGRAARRLNSFRSV